MCGVSIATHIVVVLLNLLAARGPSRTGTELPKATPVRSFRVVAQAANVHGAFDLVQLVLDHDYNLAQANVAPSCFSLRALTEIGTLRFETLSSGYQLQRFSQALTAWRSSTTAGGLAVGRVFAGLMHDEGGCLWCLN